MNKSLKAKIAELKADEDRVWRIVEDGISFGLLILERGERMYVEKDGKALICEISARHSLILPSSITEWDDDGKIGDTERERLLEEIIRFYKVAYKDFLRVFTSDTEIP